MNGMGIPKVCGRSPGRGGFISRYRQPHSLLAWDDYTVHKIDATPASPKTASTIQFRIPGGLIPKVQPWDRVPNQAFKAHLKE